MTIQFLNSKNEVVAVGSVSPTLTADVLDNWVRAAEDFEIVPEVKTIRISSNDDPDINFDELLVRHTACNVYYDITAPGKFVVNNYPIGK